MFLGKVSSEKSIKCIYHSREACLKTDTLYFELSRGKRCLAKAAAGNYSRPAKSEV